MRCSIFGLASPSLNNYGNEVGTILVIRFPGTSNLFRIHDGYKKAEASACTADCLELATRLFQILEETEAERN